MRPVRSLSQRLSGYPELVAVIIAAIVGLAFQAPFRILDDHQGLNVVLAVLVLVTGLGIPIESLRGLRSRWGRILATLSAAVLVEPVVAWLASRLVAAGSLRDGVIALGVAPCEIASVATTAMAGGDAALAAGVLIGSTICTILLAGPLLSLESTHVSVASGHLALTLLVVVAIPLAVGIALRAVGMTSSHRDGPASWTSTLAVAGLVALIAAQVHLSSRYIAVVLAVVVFVLGGAGLGALVGIGGSRPGAVAVLLTLSMRDFAIAASLAASTFGPPAAAPLGVYGIVVLIWGTAVAGRLRHRGDSGHSRSLEAT